MQFFQLEPNDYFGRKVVIIASGVIMVIGGAIQTASFFSWYVLGIILFSF